MSGSTTMPELPTDGPVYVIGYVRVSDRSQKYDGASLETQAAAIKKYCGARGWTLLDVVEEVYSGEYLTERKQLSTRVRTRVREGEVHVVIVNSLDRLSRNQIHQAVLLHEMMEHNVSLVSVTEELDTSALGNFLRQAIGFAAELEREKILERAARGTQNRVDKGQMIGVGVPKYGYDWGENHACYIVNLKEAEIVREVFERYAYRGQSLRSIAKWLNDTGVPTRLKGRNGKPGKWCASTLKNMIESEEYRGKGYNRTWKWIRVDGKRKSVPHPNPTPLPDGVIPRIIEDDLWFAANTKREVAKAESPRNNKEPEATLLRSGYIFCGYCGRPMSVSRARRYYSKSDGREKFRNAQYYCNSGGGTPGTCRMRTTILVHIIDDAAWKFVKKLLDNLDRIREVLQAPLQRNAEADLQSVESLIEATQAEAARRVEDMRGLSGYTRQLIVEELNRIEERLIELQKMKLDLTPNVKREEGLQHDIEVFLQWCENLKGRYDESDYEERRRALRHLGIKVHIYQAADSEHKRYVITARPELFKRLKQLKKVKSALKDAEESPQPTEESPKQWKNCRINGRIPQSTEEPPQTTENSVQVCSQTATRYPLLTSRAI